MSYTKQSVQNGALKYIAAKTLHFSGRTVVVPRNSIAHVGAAAGYPVSKSRTRIILYCLYGTSLAYTGERLAIEHPQRWKYGLVFPKAYTRGAIDDLAVCAESYRQLMEMQPQLLTRLSTKTQSMMATSMADPNAVHKGAKSPYGKMVTKYPDKRGTQIPEEDIAAFTLHSRSILLDERAP